jgi:hypothetical protein
LARPASIGKTQRLDQRYFPILGHPKYGSTAFAANVCNTVEDSIGTNRHSAIGKLAQFISDPEVVQSGQPPCLSDPKHGAAVMQSSELCHAVKAPVSTAHQSFDRDTAVRAAESVNHMVFSTGRYSEHGSIAADATFAGDTVNHVVVKGELTSNEAAALMCVR